MSSSIVKKHPQRSPNFLNTSQPHKCSGSPSTLTQSSLRDPPLWRHPTSGCHLSRCKKLSLNLLTPLMSTLSASELSSKSNKSNAPPKAEIVTPPLLTTPQTNLPNTSSTFPPYNSPHPPPTEIERHLPPPLDPSWPLLQRTQQQSLPWGYSSPQPRSPTP